MKVVLNLLLGKKGLPFERRFQQLEQQDLRMRALSGCRSWELILSTEVSGLGSMILTLTCSTSSQRQPFPNYVTLTPLPALVTGVPMLRAPPVPDPYTALSGLYGASAASASLLKSLWSLPQLMRRARSTVKPSAGFGHIG